ncbi:hypothetical protein JW930_05170 [Candidatus Woesearchaeota archaeon]|nr:hypothetical protein [Candidatus Woesearchaeota archaeon]
MTKQMPAQHGVSISPKLIIGLIGIGSSVIMLMQLIGRDTLQLPKPFLEYVTGVCCILGCGYMVFRSIWKPRIYFK